MGYTITTLVENCVYGRKLQAEHGLSLYIETSEHRLLFDTGASDLFIRNARLLHIDLQKVDYLILSHGHSDVLTGIIVVVSVLMDVLKNKDEGRVRLDKKKIKKTEGGQTQSK